MYTILHLETSLVSRKVVKEICSELGIAYQNASSVEDALGILEKESISMILTAMEIEGGNSASFIRTLNSSAYKNIPVIVFTGNDTLEDRKKMYDLGIVDFILKSSDREVIKQSIAVYRKDDPMDSAVGSLEYAVLDDSTLDCKIIDRIFSMHGIKSIDYYDSGHALLRSSKRYDVYIVDIVLKDTTGDKVIAALRAQNAESVIIAISGIDNVKTISRVLSLGASDYQTKPFNYEIFIARLKTNIRSYILLREVKAKTHLLEQMAVTDSLTGMFNRRYLFDMLGVETDKAKRYGSTFSVIIFDIDHFKKINDTQGHHRGDEILKKVSAVIKSSVRTVDVAGRYGGEEFLVILTESEAEGAAAVADRIRQEVGRIDGGVVTISGGVAEFAGDSAEDLLKRADLLLYRAKESGRDNIQR